MVGLHGGQVEGIDGEATRLNAWQQASLDFTAPPVPARPRLVECVNERGRPDRLLVIEVETSDKVHLNRREDVYLRVGDEDRRLSFTQAQELIYDKGQAFYESTPADVELGELDDRLLTSYARALGHPDAVRLLTARGLISRAGAIGVGALLLFGRDPQRRYPEATVRVLRYRGSERGAGARHQLVDDVRCEGPIPHVLREAAGAVAERIPTRQALGADGRFEPVGIVPRDAWLEGLVNAVIHRSYSVVGDHVRVEIFDDRIDVESPGRFPGLVDPGDPMSITRFARNPRIARVCADMRWARELGEGIRRMFEEMRLAGLADPSYRQTSGSVRLTLSSLAVDRELEARLPVGSRELMRVVRETPRTSTGDLARALDLSRPVAIRRLRRLQNEGLIEWVGNSPKDPRPYWRLRS